MAGLVKQCLGLGNSLPIGEKGERRAAQFLKNGGYRVIARNWRSPRDRRDEIDLVCWRDEVLVFVEVKSRAAHARVGGFEAVDGRKKRAVRRAIDAYLRGLAPRDRPRTFRFDIVAIATVAATREFKIQHFENVPLFSKDYGHFQ